MRRTRNWLASLLLAPIALAQQVVAPTPENVGGTRGEDMGGYNVINSFETGYRVADIHGNRGKYRSDVNFRNGLRLLGSNFSVNSKNGQGWLFDEILLNTQGLGNDPYQFSNLRIQKNRLYRYDMLWRLNEYYNPGLTISEGRHFRDTSRRMQDHDLILLPQAKIQFRFGYSRSNQDGPALSTVQLFDSRGDEFAPFTDIRRLWNQYRVGSDIELAGFKFSWLRAWDNFKEDTSYALGEDPGARPIDVTSVTGFRRVEPYHGNSPFWRGALRGERSGWAINARLTYVGSRRGFVLDENAAGISRTALNRQILVTGNASRPATAGDFSLSLFPTARLTLVNNTAVHSLRIDGNSLYREVNNSFRSDDLVFFRFLGIRTIANSTDANLRISQAVGLYGGYHFSTRRIRSIENFDIPALTGVLSSVTAEQENKVHSGLAGLRLKPTKPLTVNLDAEISRADRPFTPVSERNFHALRGRVQYKAKSLLLSAAYRENYNTNAVSLSAHSSRARNYSYDASWVPLGWFAFDAGYSKLHLDTVSGIAFFADGALLRGLSSIYISNIHAGNFGARVAIKKLGDLYIGYSITRDTGDGRAAPVPAGTTSATPLLLGPAETFPLSFQSPLARLSVRLGPKLRLNAGWQFYSYHEDFQLWVAPQNYRAHTGYTSVLWSF